MTYSTSFTFSNSTLVSPATDRLITSTKIFITRLTSVNKWQTLVSEITLDKWTDSRTTNDVKSQHKHKKPIKTFMKVCRTRDLGTVVEHSLIDYHF